ncbi:MAG: FGGY family carbohydrate kinase [Streptosporangiaceae bacterium]
MNVLAIDQGTSATKALVVGPDGEVLAQAEAPVHPQPTAGGGVEQDPEELWSSVLDTGTAALEQAAVPVGAVGLANQGETVLAWDARTGLPLTAAISWQDRRAREVVDRLGHVASELHGITGLPLDPYFAAPKMAWLRERSPRGGVITTTDSWLVHRLTGDYVTDAATASRTMLLDLDRTAWSEIACQVFGFRPETLPVIKPCAGIVGETGVFGKPIPLAGLAVDQQAALFAESCFLPGDAKCTYGTGAFLLATAGRSPRRSDAGLAASVAWQLADETTYCLDGQVYTAGAAISWLTDLGLIQDASSLDGVGGGVPSSGGVTFVPGLAGLAAPFWKPSARGSFTGLTLATTRAHLVRAVIEGIAAEVTWLARAAAEDLGRPLTQLRVDGGLTRSRVLLQTQADLLQAVVEVHHSPNATALGVGALARLGIGAAATPAAAIGSRAPAAIFEPRVSADEAEGRLQRWRKAAEATVELHD